MYKTPVAKTRKSVITKSNTRKTPVDLQSSSVIEPSVLDTPEETGDVNFQYFKSKIFLRKWSTSSVSF